MNHVTPIVTLFALAKSLKHQMHLSLGQRIIRSRRRFALQAGKREKSCVMSFHLSGKPVCHGLTSYTQYRISQGPNLSIAGILLIEHLGSTLHFAGCLTFFQDGGRLRIAFCAGYCVTKFLDQPRCSLTESMGIEFQMGHVGTIRHWLLMSCQVASVQ